MAIAINDLTSGEDATDDQTTKDTASISPTGNALIVLALFYISNSGRTGVPAVTGCGCTWVNDGYVALGGGFRWIQVYRTMAASPSSGAVTFTANGADEWDHITWSIVEYTGVETSGANGAGAVVAANKIEDANATGSVHTLTYNQGFGAVGNAGFAAFAIGGGGFTGAPRTNWTEIEDIPLGSGHGFENQYRLANDTAALVTWSGGTDKAGIAHEIVAASAGGVAALPASSIQRQMGHK